MTKQALPWLRGLGSLCCSAMGTGPARGEKKKEKAITKGLERGQNSSLYTGNQPKALWLQAGWAFVSLITGTCEIPNTSFNCGGPCAILATASAVAATQAELLLGVPGRGESQGWPRCSCKATSAPVPPSPHTRQCWGTSGLSEWLQMRSKGTAKSQGYGRLPGSA